MTLGPGEYLEPTARARRLIAARYLAFVLLYVALRIGIPRFVHFVSSKPLCDQIPWWRLWIGALAVLALAAAFRLVQSSIRAIAAGQNPLPGTPVFFRTAIRRGWRRASLSCSRC